jgi:hypothetical protein
MGGGTVGCRSGIVRNRVDCDRVTGEPSGTAVAVYVLLSMSAPNDRLHDNGE